MIFAYAAIFVMTNMFSFFLFGANMIVIVCLLIMVNLQFGQPMDIQLINAVTFTIVAFILSRFLFFFNLKDFTNHLLINRQAG